MKDHIIIPLLLICSGILLSSRLIYSPPPSNDQCNNADVIIVSGGGFDYGVYTSTVSDLTTATTQAGEFLQFAPNHIKSV
ncbi:MAG: hypothetical protein ABIQ02_01130, partial [Saprospiraceae bacterium]